MSKSWTVGLPLPQREFTGFRPLKYGRPNSRAEGMLRNLQNLLDPKQRILHEERVGIMGAFHDQEITKAAKAVGAFQHTEINLSSGRRCRIVRLVDDSMLILPYNARSGFYEPLPYAFQPDGEIELPSFKKDTRIGATDPTPDDGQVSLKNLFQDFDEEIADWMDICADLPPIFLVDQLPPDENDAQLIAAWANCSLLTDPERILLREFVRDMASGLAAKLPRELEGRTAVEIDSRHLNRNGTVGDIDVSLEMPWDGSDEHNAFAREFSDTVNACFDDPSFPVEKTAQVSLFTDQNAPIDRWTHQQSLLARCVKSKPMSAHERMAAIARMKQRLNAPAQKERQEERNSVDVE